jgi:hypothetical protein
MRDRVVTPGEDEAAMGTHGDEPGGLRTGVRRVIPRREFRHLRAWGTARVGGGVVLSACSILTLSFGRHDPKAYRWAGAFLVLAALNVAGGLWELTIARQPSSGG